MSEAPKNNPDYLKHHPDAVENTDKAHELAIRGDTLQTKLIPYQIAEKALQTAFILGETPAEAIEREVASRRRYTTREVNVNPFRNRPNDPKETVVDKVLPVYNKPENRAMEARGLLNADFFIPPLEGADAGIVEELKDVLGITEEKTRIEDELAGIYAQRPATDEQKKRAAELGLSPDVKLF